MGVQIVLKIFKNHRDLFFSLINAYCLTLMLTFNRTISITSLKTFSELFQTDATISVTIFIFSLYFFSKIKIPKLFFMSLGAMLHTRNLR